MGGHSCSSTEAAQLCALPVQTQNYSYFSTKIVQIGERPWRSIRLLPRPLLAQLRARAYQELAGACREPPGASGLEYFMMRVRAVAPTLSVGIPGIAIKASIAS